MQEASGPRYCKTIIQVIGIKITNIHVNAGDFAMQDGVIPESKYSNVYSRTSHPCKEDLITSETRIVVLPKKMNSIIELFATEKPKVYELI